MIFAVVILFVGAMGAFFIWVGNKNEKISAEDLCPTDRNVPIPKIIVVLFDQTSKLPQMHQLALKSKFRRLIYDEFESEAAQTKSRFSRIEVYSFRAKSQLGELDIQRHLALCNPGNVDSLTKFYKNPEQVRRTFETRFRTNLDQQLDGLLEFKDSPRTPLFEAIKHVSLGSLSDPRYERSEKHFVIVSDMLHNSREFSMLGKVPRFSEFRALPYSHQVMPDLKGVEVKLLVLSGDNPRVQGRDFLEFWREFFWGSGIVKSGLSAIKIP